MSQQREKSQKLIVAAIDFGTTFSGWSFLFGHQFESDPTKVFAKNWNNGTKISSKTPTTILIVPDGNTIEKFGYEAEDRYATLASENKHRNHYYFTRFKMTLHDKINLKRDILLDDENGKKLPALRVFSLAIKYIHDNLLIECNKQLTGEGIREDDINWVITVPAIWNDAAKQFMWEAAEMVLPDGNIKELHSASGGAWGGTKVDETFFQFLIKIFGAPVMKKFKTKHMDDYIELIRDFEVKKRVVSSEDVATQLRLSATLVELFTQETGESFEETFQQTSFRNTVTLLSGNKLRFEADCMRSFFGPAVQSIIGHHQGLIQDQRMGKAKFLLMVGGFSESIYLQDNIKKVFTNMRVIIPPEAGLVVLKGAAIFGHSTNAISERKSKFTYGFCGYGHFKEGIDPEEHSCIKDGQQRLNDAFFILGRREWKQDRCAASEKDTIIFPLYFPSRKSHVEPGVPTRMKSEH